MPLSAASCPRLRSSILLALSPTVGVTNPELTCSQRETRCRYSHTAVIVTTATATTGLLREFEFHFLSLYLAKFAGLPGPDSIESIAGFQFYFSFFNSSLSDTSHNPELLGGGTSRQIFNNQSLWTELFPWHCPQSCMSCLDVPNFRSVSGCCF